MQIRTITLKRLRRALAAMLCVLSLSAVSGCEQAASLVGRAAGGSQAERATSFQARVVAIADGDTITVVDALNQQHRIRLAEIDAPERGQPWGDRSRQALSQLVFGKTVSVQQTDTDRYGRVVGRVFADGRDVNRTMVQQGAAWAYREHTQDQTLIATEARARRERAGLWSMSDAQTVAPWAWRQGIRVGSGDHGPPVGQERVQGLFSPAPRSAYAGSNGSFVCSGKQYCRQMSSCAEAQFNLRQCGVGTLDGDGDGRPCEAIC